MMWISVWIRYSIILSAMLLLLVFVRCQKKKTEPCDDSTRLFTHADFPIGVAININAFNFQPRHRLIVEKQFNSYTAENIFKPSFLHPFENVFDFSAADSLTRICLSSGKRMHGHTLIWHQQLPDWMEVFSGSKDDWLKMFKNHIHTIVKHYKGRVHSWDVVNEAFNEDGTLRNSLWQQNIGDDYVEKAFIYANEADPNVLLFYNDYNLESNPTKRRAVLSYLNRLRTKGIRIDGIGLQMHVALSFPEVAQINECFANIAANNYLVHVSELDVSVNMFGKDIVPSSELFQKQAEYLGKIVLGYKQIPSALQYGITFWGLTDADSWIPQYYNREDYPLLYDINYNPKPAYCKLKEVL